jgi:hypothetical protein
LLAADAIDGFDETADEGINNNLRLTLESAWRERGDNRGDKFRIVDHE